MSAPVPANGRSVQAKPAGTADGSHVPFLLASSHARACGSASWGWRHLSRLRDTRGTPQPAGNPVRFTVLEVVRAVERATGRQVPLHIGARRPGDPPVLVASSKKATPILGSNPRRSPLNEIEAPAISSQAHAGDLTVEGTTTKWNVGSFRSGQPTPLPPRRPLPGCGSAVPATRVPDR